jgi:hypothetical protein
METNQESHFVEYDEDGDRIINAGDLTEQEKI